jgi:hypothetical protein
MTCVTVYITGRNGVRHSSSNGYEPEYYGANRM